MRFSDRQRSQSASLSDSGSENTVALADLIKAAAKADGGVHFEPPKFPKEALALDYDEVCTAFGQANSRWVLKQVCYIVVTGLLPLVEAIQSRDTPR